MRFPGLFARTPTIEPEPALERLRRHASTAIDVREPREWKAGRIQGSRHIPLHTLAARLAELDRRRHYVVVCRSGSRSARAARMLRREGFEADSLHGGLRAWARAGLPLEPRGGRVV
jgi:rhodanese-related sulfurtransferase